MTDKKEQESAPEQIEAQPEVDPCEVPPVEDERPPKVSTQPGGAKRDSYFKHRDYDH